MTTSTVSDTTAAATTTVYEAPATDSGWYLLDNDGSVSHDPDNENFISGGRFIGFIVISLEDLGGVVEGGSIEFAANIGTFERGVDTPYDQTVVFRGYGGDVARLLAGGDKPDVYNELETGVVIAQEEIPYVPDLQERDGEIIAYPPAIAPFSTDLLPAGLDFVNDALERGDQYVAFSITLPDMGPGGAVFAQTDHPDGVSFSLSISDTVLSGVDDAGATDEDTPTTIDVLANDSGEGVPGADPLSVVSVAGLIIAPGGSVTLASGAVVTLTAEGELEYDPSGAYDSLAYGDETTDAFLYEVSNGLSTATGEVTVTVTGVNDAPTLRTPIPDQTATADAPVEFTLDGATFDDVDEGDYPYISARLADGGALPAWLSFDVSGSPGTFSGTPGAEDVGELEIRVTATDERGATVSDVFVLVVEAGGPANRAPVAANDSAALEEDKSAAGQVLDNDSDPDGDPLSVLAVDGAPVGVIEGELGTLTIGENGEWSYEADRADALVEGETAQEVFDLIISDGRGGQAASTLTFTVTGTLDAVTGGGGDDTLKGGPGDDKLAGKGGDDTLIGKGGPDMLLGAKGKDLLKGGGGDDVLLGGRGADVLVGGAGDDVLRGKHGDDVLKGKAGADVLVFARGDGKDKVVGWEDGVDLIRIVKGASDFADLDIAQHGGRTVIGYGGGLDMIVLKNTDAGDLDALDFLFA